jgi:hypothetical protein
MNKFHQKVEAWLSPLEYTEIYKINFPTVNNDEIHFIKDSIRVVCIRENNYEHCYLYMDIFKKPFAISIKTGNFKIETKKLDQLHKYLLDQYKLLKS